MILTGKAKDNFLDSNGKKEAWINIMLPIYQYALIIEWFDSVGIYINVFYKYIWRVEIRDSQSSLLSTLDYAVFDTRQEATKQAIIKANDIYNERFK